MDSCRGFHYFFNNYGGKSSGIEGNVASMVIYENMTMDELHGFQ